MAKNKARQFLRERAKPASPKPKEGLSKGRLLEEFRLFAKGPKATPEALRRLLREWLTMGLIQPEDEGAFLGILPGIIGKEGLKEVLAHEGSLEEKEAILGRILQRAGLALDED